jgi:glycosyltransferase involved in cell wall biosynthesis
VLVLASDLERPGPDPDPRLDAGVEVRRELRWYWREHGFPRPSARERLAIERHNAAVLRRALADHRPDAVSWWAMGGMSLSLIERVRAAGVPSVAAVCDDWFAYGREVDAWSRALARRRLLGAAVAAATGVPARVDLGGAIDVWVFLGRDLSTRAADAGVVDSREAVVARAGPDLDLFRPAPPRERWSWRLLNVGRVDERKGIDLAVEALAELPPEATLTAIGAGDDEHRARLLDLARASGVADRVDLRESGRTEIPAAMAASDAVLFPVRWREPWGLVPLEAMAVGRPVVATGRGGSGEYLRDGENSLLFDPDAGAAPLAAAVRRLAGDAALRERLVARGRATVEEIGEGEYEAAVVEALERVALRARE